MFLVLKATCIDKPARSINGAEKCYFVWRETKSERVGANCRPHQTTKKVPSDTKSDNKIENPGFAFASRCVSKIKGSFAELDTGSCKVQSNTPYLSFPRVESIDRFEEGIQNSEEMTGDIPTTGTAALVVGGEDLRETEEPLVRRASKRSSSKRQSSYQEVESDTDESLSESTKKVSTKKGRGGGKSKPSPRQSSTTPMKYVDEPTDNDILSGHRNMGHPGNVVYRDLVRQFQPTFKTTETQIEATRNIISHIYNEIGGRFLKFDNKSKRWELVPENAVFERVRRATFEYRGKKGPSIRTSPKITKDESVTESLGNDQALTSTGQHKRKVNIAPKANGVTTATELPSNQQKKKRKLRGSKKDLSQKSSRSGGQRLVKAEPVPEEYIHKPDPNEYYVEETAHIYHNPPFPSELTGGVEIEDLRPIPPPSPLPTFPQSDTCKWSYDESSRVLIADFSVGNQGKGPVATLEDSKFLFEMYERTDITVISRGLLNTSKVIPSMWNLEYLRKCVGREFYHKFRRFDRTVDKNGIETYKEMDSLLSMRFEDYVKYCEIRGSFLSKNSTSSPAEEPIFAFEDHLGKVHNVGVGKSALYMIDVDINRLTPLLNKNFLESFELPSVLPGGSHCMMNSVSINCTLRLSYIERFVCLTLKSFSRCRSHQMHDPLWGQIFM